MKEFQKTLLTLSQIPDEKTCSLIMSQPEENGPPGVLNEKFIFFQAPVKDYYRVLDFPIQLWQQVYSNKFA